VCVWGGEGVGPPHKSEDEPKAARLKTELLYTLSLLDRSLSLRKLGTER
jgi:hypothetical protein